MKEKPVPHDAMVQSCDRACVMLNDASKLSVMICDGILKMLNILHVLIFQLYSV